MSAYQYQAPAVTRDPTAVVGRRTVAAIIDGLIVSVPATIAATADFEYLEEDDVGVPLDDFCDVVQDQDDVVACAQAGDRVYFAEDVSPLPWILGFGLSVLLLVVLQGLKGITPGKALLGIRTVGEDGRPPGLGKAIVRWLLLIVDWFPWCLPLLGFILVLSTNGHRRLGDMAAKTYVVSKADAGQPIVVPGIAPPYAAAGYGGAPVPPGAGWGAPGAPGAPGSGDAWGASGPPGAPGAPGAPGSGDDWGAPPGAYGAPQPPPGAWGAPPSTGETPAVAQPAPAPAPPPAPAEDEHDPTMTFGTGAATPPPGATTSGDDLPAASPAGSTAEAGPGAGSGADEPTVASPAATPPVAGSGADTDAGADADAADTSADDATVAGEGVSGEGAGSDESAEAATPSAEPDQATAADTSPSSAYEPDKPTRLDDGAPGAAGPTPGYEPDQPTRLDEGASEAPSTGYQPDQPTRAEGQDTEVFGAVPPSSPLDVEPPAQAQPADQQPAAAEQPADQAPPADAGQQGAQAAGQQATYNPQWDAARGTYIVWEPGRGKWLGWDDNAKEWKPL